MLPSTERLTFAKKSATPHFWMGTSTSFVMPASALKVTVIWFVLESYSTSSASNAARAVLTIVSMCPSRVSHVRVQVLTMPLQESAGTEQTSSVEDGEGRVIPAWTDAVAGVAHGRTVVPAWNLIFISARTSTGGGPISMSHSASPPMFKPVPSLLQEQVRGVLESSSLIKGDSTLQIALSVAASPGKRARSREV